MTATACMRNARSHNMVSVNAAAGSLPHGNRRRSSGRRSSGRASSAVGEVYDAAGGGGGGDDGNRLLRARDSDASSGVSSSSLSSVFVASPPGGRGGAPKTLKVNLDLFNWKAGKEAREAMRAKRWRARDRDAVSRRAGRLAHHIRGARQLYERCLKLDPLDGRAYVGLGRLLSEHGLSRDGSSSGQAEGYAAARQVFEDGAAATQGDNPYIWQAWAVMEQRAGNMARARELFDNGTVADPTHAASWHGWASLEVDEGNLARARQLLRSGLRRLERRARAAGVDVGVTTMPSAASEIAGGSTAGTGAASMMDSTNARMVVSLAAIEQDLGNVEEARLLFRRASTRRGGMGSARLILSWARLEAAEGDIDRARDLFSRATTLAVEDRCSGPRTRSYVATAWAAAEIRAGALDRAEAVLLDYVAGEEIDDNGGVAHDAHGTKEEEEGRSSASQGEHLPSASTTVESRQPVSRRTSRPRPRRPDPIVMQVFGVLHSRRGDIEAARGSFRSGIRAAESLHDIPSQLTLWQAWGMHEWRSRAPTRAREAFRRGVEVHEACNLPGSECARLLQAWGAMEAREGNVEVARSLFKKAVDTGAGSVTVLETWAEMERTLGSMSEARRLAATADAMKAADAGKRSVGSGLGLWQW